MNNLIAFPGSPSSIAHPSLRTPLTTQFRCNFDMSTTATSAMNLIKVWKSLRTAVLSRDGSPNENAENKPQIDINSEEMKLIRSEMREEAKHNMKLIKLSIPFVHFAFSFFPER